MGEQYKKFNPVGKPCKECGKEFFPSKSTQRACSMKCAIDLAKKATQLNIDKKVRKDKKEMKVKSMTLTEWKDKLQDHINTIVRLIDHNQPCIASKATKCQFHAGHYVSRGSNDSLRYNLHNIHKQSAQSNKDRHGDTINFQDGLKRVYGSEYFQYVESLRQTKPIKLKIWEIKDKIVICGEIIKELKKLGKTYTARERVDLRNEYNFRIGIYK